MPSYVALLDWTEQGIRGVRESLDRKEAAVRHMGELGVRLTDIRWTLGAHDVVCFLEAPDDETLAAALLGVASLGNVRTTTMRAFTLDEMRAVLSKVP
jgi:uncharacterized protein with GYD domain